MIQVFDIAPKPPLGALAETPYALFDLVRDGAKDVLAVLQPMRGRPGALTP
jgi:hypothetical protein